MNDPALQPVRVWDLPTRLFHWLLAAALVGSVVSAKIGGAAMTWHFRFGYLVLGLLVFRLSWGLVGGRWSRFASFVYAPGTLLRYLRGQARPGEHLDVGHSPLGALSVFALLAIVAVQVGTGLVADDEIANLGPLNRFVATATALEATAWHKSYGQWLVIGLVALHVAAVLAYLFVKRRNLIGPMLVGDKPLPAGTPASADGLAQRLLALVLALLAAGVVAWVIRLGQPAF
ncbi:MAG: cytochrome b/b6 domain-containing protein [Rubrivivax sp.]|nr:cytochrome b/b6 domain-containing protein [Rubrivivax sp.]